MKIIKKIPQLPKRPYDSHKGMYGRILVVAGSLGMSGAAALVGRAALRAGAGLVRVAVPKSILPIVASIEPCFTTIPLAEDASGKISLKAINTVLDAVADNDCVAIGPGLGKSGELQSIVENLIQQDTKIVIDADGLNNLSKIKNWPDKVKAELILTPHPGEMKNLWTNLSREQIPDKKINQALKLSHLTKSVTVLKGAGTVVTDGEKVYVNTTGNPGMATGGTGDVLTGIIAALIGQHLSNFEAAVLGVYVHGLAGDIAVKEIGQVSLIATDIVDNLNRAFLKLERK